MSLLVRIVCCPPLRRKLERDSVIVRPSTIRSKPQAYSASVALKLRPNPSALLVTIHAATPETQRVGESGHVQTWQILLKKSFLADERDFLEPLMRSACGDVRDHIVLHKNDYRPSYRP